MTIIGETLSPDPIDGQLQRAIFRSVAPKRGPEKRGLWERKAGALAHGIEFEIKQRTLPQPRAGGDGPRTEKYIEVHVYESFQVDPAKPPVRMGFRADLVDFVKEILELTEPEDKKQENRAAGQATTPLPDTLDPLSGICAHCDNDAVGGAVIPAGVDVPPRDVLFCEEHRALAIQGVNPVMLYALIDDAEGDQPSDERKPA